MKALIFYVLVLLMFNSLFSQEVMIDKIDTCKRIHLPFLTMQKREEMYNHESDSIKRVQDSINNSDFCKNKLIEFKVIRSNLLKKIYSINDSIENLNRTTQYYFTYKCNCTKYLSEFNNGNCTTILTYDYGHYIFDKVKNPCLEIEFEIEKNWCLKLGVYGTSSGEIFNREDINRMMK